MATFFVAVDASTFYYAKTVHFIELTSYLIVAETRTGATYQPMILNEAGYTYGWIMKNIHFIEATLRFYYAFAWNGTLILFGFL